MLGGNGEVQQGRLITTINLPTECEIGFDIKPSSSTLGRLSSVVVFTTGAALSGVPGTSIGSHRTTAVYFTQNTHRLMIVDGITTDALSDNSLMWGCNLATLTLRANKISRVQLILKLKTISVYVNGKVGCSNIPRGVRKQLDNIQVYLSGPWHPAAKARVKNLYFRRLVFVTKPKPPIKPMQRSTWAFVDCLISQNTTATTTATKRIKNCFCCTEYKFTKPRTHAHPRAHVNAHLMESITQNKNAIPVSANLLFNCCSVSKVVLSQQQSMGRKMRLAGDV